MYIKYQHVEKIGTDEVEGILDGVCWIFPKIDGTNAHVWKDGFGSRNRELSLDNDNQGFMAWASGEDWSPFFDEFGDDCHIYGEWLVPHTLKTYTEDAWRKFYIFDVVILGKHIPYNEYCEIEGYNFIPPITKIKNPTRCS
jgi:hypothetical protein